MSLVGLTSPLQPRFVCWSSHVVEPDNSLDLCASTHQPSTTTRFDRASASRPPPRLPIAGPHFFLIKHLSPRAFVPYERELGGPSNAIAQGFRSFSLGRTLALAMSDRKELLASGPLPNGYINTTFGGSSRSSGPILPRHHCSAFWVPGICRAHYAGSRLHNRS